MNSNLVSTVAKNLDLKESEVVWFLTILSTHPIIELKELIRLTGLPETNLKRLLKSFADILEPASDKVVIKADQLNQLVDYLSICGFELENEKDIPKIIAVLDKYSYLRSQAKREFDQFFATIDTTIKRSLFLKKAGELYNQSLLFLGDDDLTSISSALVAHKCTFTVVDIDSQILAYIDKVATDTTLPITTIQTDLKNDLPSSLKSQYDLVFTDPPYTPSGISLFLNKAIQSLKPALTSRIYLCFGTSDRATERELVIQKIIYDKGLRIKEKFDKFNHYNGAESIGSSSSIYILGWTPKTTQTGVSADNIYTNE